MKIITFGELLMRLTPPQNQRFAQANSYTINYGGAEANAAITLAQLGHDVEFVSALPSNEIGRSALREMTKWGINTTHVQFNGQKMGLYFMEQGVSVRGGNIVYDREGSSFCNINDTTFDWDSILDKAEWFHWTGITPALSAGAAKACLKAIKVANKKGIKVSCDLNYRSKLWNYGADPKDVMPELIANSNIVLANEDDVSEYLGLTARSGDAEIVEGFGERNYKFVSEAIVKAYPKVDQVITTLRQTINATHNLWSGVSYDGQKFLKGRDFDINNIVDRVGGGDSFMGAFIHGISKFEHTQEALDFALAASSLKLTISGDYNIVSETEIMNFLNHEGVGRISR